jgi:hypothetical protein
MSIHRLQILQTRDRLFLVGSGITGLIVLIAIVSSDRRQKQTTSKFSRFRTTSHQVCETWSIIKTRQRVVEADATIWNS